MSNKRARSVTLLGCACADWREVRADCPVVVALAAAYRAAGPVDAAGQLLAAGSWRV